MIRADPIDLRPFDDLTRFAKQYPARFRTVARTVYNERSPDLLSAVSRYPGKRAQHPFVWSLDKVKNARARGAYFALVNAGLIKTDGYGAIRTGKLGQSYTTGITISGTDVIVSLRNNDPAYKFVKGKRQLPGHAATGWQSDKPIIDDWVRDYTLAVVREMRVVKGATGG